MSLKRNFTASTESTTKLKPGDIVKDGILFFCGRPASWIAYRIYSKQKSKIPSIEEARASTKIVNRDPKSFRPDVNKLKKTTVYPAKFVFGNANVLRYVCAFDENGNLIETYFYCPLK